MKNRQRNAYLKIVFAVLTITLITSQCSYKSSGDIYSGTGVGGSLNKFTIIDSFLYVINKSHVETFKINNGEMDFVGATLVDESIETVFPFDSIVLVGGQFGMYICNRAQNGLLEVASRYEHIESCDPVVTDGIFAYVTLSSGCRSQTDQLEILNIEDITNPVLLKTYPMQNPKGLGLDNNLLFICDTSDGLKVYDRTDPVNIQLIHHFTHIYPFDVIPYNGLLFVMTDTAIHQFDYSDPSNIYEISTTLMQ